MQPHGHIINDMTVQKADVLKSYAEISKRGVKILQETRNAEFVSKNRIHAMKTSILISF